MKRARQKTWLLPALLAAFFCTANPVFADPEPEPELGIENVRALASEGRLEEALELVERLIRAQEEAQDHPEVAALLREYAALVQRRGDYRSAERALQRAISILERSLGEEHPGVAAALNELATLYQARWEYGRAELLLRRSLRIEEQALGSSHPHVAVSLNNLILLHRMRGDCLRAEPFAERALAILEASFGPDHPNVASALNNLALLLRDKGDFGRAEPLLLRALAILERSQGKNSPMVATALANVALVRRDKGDYEGAKPLLRRALRIREHEYGPTHVSVADTLSALSNLYFLMNDYARAESTLERALSIWENAYGKNHPDVATALIDLASLYAMQGSLDAAVRMRARAAEIQDRQAALALAIGAEEYKRAYMATLSKDTDATVSLHVLSAPESSDAARLSFTTILRRKGRVLDAMSDNLASLRRSLLPEDQRLLDRLLEKQAALAASFARGPDQSSVGKYRATIMQLDRERQKLEDEISARSGAFRAERHLVSIEEVYPVLPRGSALVSLFQYRPFRLTPGGSGEEADEKEPRYVAYVLSAAGEISFADLGEARVIDEGVGALRRALGDPSRDPRGPARALDARVMKPIRALLGETRQVFLSPDGALNLVPFGALLDEDGRYLLERYSFTYLTSGRDLLRFSVRSSPRQGAMVIAAPDFGDPSAKPGVDRGVRGRRSLDMAKVHFPPLPKAEAEARAIAGVLGKAELLLGAQATEAAVKGVHGPRILHIATHGFFLPAERPADELRLENRLLRSGLAFASANLRSSGSEDGILTALEASGLDLNGTRLIVLSACETGVGEASLGEGVYGLRRALVMAGAESQVMSLWRVDDEETRRLMIAYYQRLLEGGGRSESLREVSLAMQADSATAHPYYWAGFIASGNGASLEGAPVVPRVTPRRGCGCVVAGDDEGDFGGVGVLVIAGLVFAVWGRMRGRTQRGDLPPQRHAACTRIGGVRRICRTCRICRICHI